MANHDQLEILKKGVVVWNAWRKENPEISIDLTILGDVNLSVAKGLETVNHIGPSTIGVDTIYKSKGTIPDAFLRGAGVPEALITYIPSLTSRAKAIQKEEALWKNRGEKVLALIPIDLDGYVFQGWESGKKSFVTSRFIADCVGWEKDNTKFEKQFGKIVQALTTGDREPPPEPKL